MNPVGDLVRAWRGLALTVAGRTEAPEWFNTSGGGLVSAIGWFVVALLLSAGAQSVAVGPPGLDQVLSGLFIQAVTLTVLGGVMALTLRFLRLDLTLSALFVPIVYFMALVQVLAIPLNLLGPNVQLIAVLVLALLIFRAGGVLAGMANGVAIAFALLCLMVLVVVPNALYIVVSQAPSPPDEYRVAQQSTFAEEMMAAGRGVLSVLVGDRRAGSYFDFTRRGLLGSFIALLLVTGLNAVLPIITGTPHESIARGVTMVVVLFVLQLGCSALVLRQLHRLDGLAPYLVASNWATFFLTLISSALAAAGIVSEMTLIFLALVVIVVEINIARLIVTLSPLQVAMFLIAQLVGVTIGLQLIGMLLPVPELAVQAVP